VLAQVIVPLQGLASALQNLSPQMRQIVVIILATVAAIGPMLIVTSKIIGVFQQLKEAVMVLRAGMALLNITLLMNPFVLIAVAVIALIAGLVLLYQHSETFRNIVDQISAVVKENLVVAFNWLKLKIDEIWPVIQNMYDKAQPVLAFLGAAVELYVVTYIKLVKFYIEAWVFVIKTAYELMKPIVMFIGGIIKDYIVAEIQAVKTAIGLATDAFDGIKTAIIIVKDAIKGPLNTIKESITTAINGAVDAVSTSIKGITGIFKTVVSGIQEIWNSTLGGKHFGFPSWLPGIGGNGFTIPMLAAGGIVSSPTLAMIGEAGPEAVVPLNHSTTSLGATYYLTINAGMGTSGASVGRDIVEAIKVFERRNGAVFQAA